MPPTLVSLSGRWSAAVALRDMLQHRAKAGHVVKDWGSRERSGAQRALQAQWATAVSLVGRRVLSAGAKVAPAADRCSSMDCLQFEHCGKCSRSSGYSAAVRLTDPCSVNTCFSIERLVTGLQVVSLTGQANAVSAFRDSLQGRKFHIDELSCWALIQFHTLPPLQS